ncbi:hypothetical protein N9L02_00205 [Gammaproteobacteria bacterium]|nr:hypothetical protein [Gammaproteobacteria bacterium]
MAVIFYPHEEDISVGSTSEKLEILLDAADKYKAAILDIASRSSDGPVDPKFCLSPKEIKYAFQWQEIALLLRQIRDLPENNKSNKLQKMDYLNKLAEVYEILRAAKMPKLEAVRLALVNEANLLR